VKRALALAEALGIPAIISAFPELSKRQLPTSGRLLIDPLFEEVFGRFVGRELAFRPGALAEGSTLTLFDPAPELAEEVCAAWRRGHYLPKPPAHLPPPEVAPVPVRARPVLVLTRGKAPHCPEGVYAQFRDTIPLNEESRAWLEGLFPRLSPKDLEELLRYQSWRAGHKGRIYTGFAPLEKLELTENPREVLKLLAQSLKAGEEEFLRELAEGSWRLELSGRKPRQVVGLLVIEGEGTTYGRPVRITASAAPGSGGVVSVEREAELAGPLFSKAVLTLAGYLRERYAEVGPFSASVSLVFEQTGEDIDGDSAGLAELLATLSALSGLPLRQDLAVTGAVDQTGEVLAVGGLTEKAEGLVAAARVLKSGPVGLVYPAANEQNLVPYGELERAIASGELRLYPVREVDEAVALLFATEPEEVHRRVAETLRRFKRLEDRS